MNAPKNTNLQVDTWLEDEGDTIAYCESICAICKGRHSDKPVCRLNFGLEAEVVYWVTGQDYKTIETHCLAKGENIAILR